MKIQAASYWKIAVWFFISRRFVSEKGDVMDAQFTAEDFPGGLRACMEAILMVADQPQHAADLARVGGAGRAAVRRPRENQGMAAHRVPPRDEAAPPGFAGVRRTDRQGKASAGGIVMFLRKLLVIVVPLILCGLCVFFLPLLGGFGNRLLTDFPEPDSPTMPRTSPGKRSNETFSNPFPGP